MLISIIIPVYNVENYLAESLDSIISQDLADCEIILVDDGSTDSSGDICDKYSNENEKITVFHKENGGLSDTRNFGVSKANGRYILFVDSDDYITPGSVAAIKKNLEHDGDSDVVFLDAKRFYRNGHSKHYIDFIKKEFVYDKTRADVIKHLTTLPKFPASACIKLVRRDFIIQNNIYFEKGLTGEDLDWSLKLFMVAESFNHCGGYVYMYRQERAGAITHTYTKKRFDDLYYTIEKWTQTAKTSEYEKEINSFMAYELCKLMSGYSMLSKSEKKQSAKKIKSLVWLFKKSSDKRISLLCKCYKIFGIGLTAKLLGFYEKRR